MFNGQNMGQWLDLKSFNMKWTLFKLVVWCGLL